MCELCTISVSFPDPFGQNSHEEFHLASGGKPRNQEMHYLKVGKGLEFNGKLSELLPQCFPGVMLGFCEQIVLGTT